MAEIIFYTLMELEITRIYPSDKQAVGLMVRINDTRVGTMTMANKSSIIRRP
ncbi:hypothetical protein IQ255_13185 [Pleurocapsales cyanobacterium LEGE 10410]|nr:hypothetical protein [Pleurocapsales cyanobacterium LEGE 10410]